MEITKLEAAAEAVLFAAGGAVGLAALASAIGQDENAAAKIVARLKDKYEADERGVCIKVINGAYQMCTNAKYYENVSAFFQSPRKRKLTQPLLETLAIIAYKQPAAKAQIEEIRGVDASFAVNKLIEYGLVCETGRGDGPGRPILFGTTDDFLRRYGLSSVDSLPAQNQQENNG